MILALIPFISTTSNISNTSTNTNSTNTATKRVSIIQGSFPPQSMLTNNSLFKSTKMSNNAAAAATPTEAETEALAALTLLADVAPAPAPDASMKSSIPHPRGQYTKKFCIDWWTKQVVKAESQLAIGKRDLDRAQAILDNRLRSELANLFGRAPRRSP
ncbi:hypothetical protein G7Z17_g9393 [Cylindrodendrum hubeiense]|uniref:Uncharacterized protein n=1 Tax=Cylindrodendrum hubeiense TaxID=595255 RepID=A0A9P5LC94_9HYPO|nr:hypothetical protein G7Z17_g9393 [Cylindrodendrum hubeiense]